ncbi:MAG: hypothetical protein WCD86_26300 [Ktedonobacteraceae bacterium]
MVKRNIIGLLWQCALQGFYIILALLSIYFFSSPMLWDIANLFLKILSVFLILGCLCLIIVCVRSLVDQCRQWRKVERMRMSPEALSNYTAQPSYAPVLRDSDMPLIIKKQMSRRILAIATITVNSVVFLLIGIMSVVALINHDLPTLQDWLLLALIALCMAAFVTLLVCVFALIEYERIEAGERGLMMQKGFWRRFVPWEQARLFAVCGKRDYEPEWIELSSAKVILRWPYSTKNDSLPGQQRKDYYMRKMAETSFQPVSRGEYEHQLSRLPGYVKMKTGLPLRDLRR